MGVRHKEHHVSGSLVTSLFTEEEITRFNRSHDARYGWSRNAPACYMNLRWIAGYCVAPPGFDKSFRKTSELDAEVWAWHTREPDPLCKL